MFSQYFGNYLLNKGMLSAQQLERALELQKSTHVKLGVLSVNAGFMTANQVEEVHHKQMQLDKRFGEIALELGYITEEQLNELLAAQKQAHLLLGQVLVDEGLMSLEEFSNALSGYKEHYSLSDEQFSAIQRGDIDTLVETMIPLEDSKIYKDYLSLFAKNMIRFVDGQIRLESARKLEDLSDKWLVYQKISGETALFTALLADDATFVDIAQKYAQEQITVADELAQASVSEFLNLHNGIFLVNMSNQGIDLEMNPQQIKENASLTNLREACVVDIELPVGKFRLVVSTDQPAIV